MKAILEFNLPEDQDEFNQAVQGGDWRHVVWDFDQYLRGEIKYAADGADPARIRAYEDIRERLHRSISEMNLSLDY
jgi:hypothetical protein